jgi:hypothetical protein
MVTLKSSKIRSGSGRRWEEDEEFASEMSVEIYGFNAANSLFRNHVRSDFFSREARQFPRSEIDYIMNPF